MKGRILLTEIKALVIAKNINTIFAKRTIFNQYTKTQ